MNSRTDRLNPKETSTNFASSDKEEIMRAIKDLADQKKSADQAASEA